MSRGSPRESFERLYAEHAAGLLGFLTYQTGDRSLAEDILADTFERALTSRGGWGGGRRRKTWLHAIALNHARVLAFRPHSEAGVEVPDLVDLDAVADSELVRLAMPSLPAEERAVVALRFGGGLSLGEIAELLEERERTIERRLYRGSRRLRETVIDLARRDVDPRATFSADELDRLRERLDQGVSLPPRRRRLANGLRINAIAGLAAIALMLTAGAGVVIAATSIGGSSGAGLGGNFDATFKRTSLHGTWDASYCQFLGPFSRTSSVPLRHGLLRITLVWDCGHLIVHITFPGRFSWSFAGGPAGTATGAFLERNAPADSTGLEVSADGSTVTLPFRLVAAAASRPNAPSRPARGATGPAAVLA